MLTFIFVPFPQACQASTDTDGSKDIMKEKVWSLEEAYFTNLYKANYEGVLAIVHSQFLGWPSTLPQPINKEESACFMKKLCPNPTLCTLKIERSGIRVLENVALTEYTLNVKYSDNDGIVKTQSSRITHTWIKDDNTWKLLGGMSYKNEPLPQNPK